MKELMKYIRLVIIALALILVATPTMATEYYRVLSGFTAGSGVLTFGNHCEATVALNPPVPPINIVEVQLHGAEAPTLTFVPWDFFIESPNITMPAPRSAGGVIVGTVLRNGGLVTPTNSTERSIRVTGPSTSTTIPWAAGSTTIARAF